MSNPTRGSKNMDTEDPFEALQKELQEMHRRIKEDIDSMLKELEKMKKKMEEDLGLVGDKQTG